MKKYSFYIYVGESENNPTRKLVECILCADNDMTARIVARSIYDTWWKNMPLSYPGGKVEMSGVKEVA